jgi:hypothetical protein
MDSPELRKSVNIFLFKEFRYDRRKKQRAVSEDWPFVLTYLGAIKTFDYYSDVYEFTWRRDAFFITCEGGLVHASYWPVAGMTINDFQNQFQGQKWLGRTIDLDTTVLGEEGIPGSIERRAAILSLAQAVPGERGSFRIRWGLYVTKRKQHIGLVEGVTTSKVWIVSGAFPPQLARLLRAGEERCIASQIGELIEQGVLAI